MSTWRYHTDDELREIAKTLAEQLANNVTSMSHSGSGSSLSYGSPANARKTLREIDAELARREGRKPARSGPSQWTIINRTGY